jgi:hypothetical protein
MNGEFPSTKQLGFGLKPMLAALAAGFILVASCWDAEAVVVRRGGAVAHRGVTRVGPHGGVYHRGTTVVRGGGAAWGVRPWVARPYFGTVVAGVTLGTIVAATAYNMAPPAPASNLCWYWTDSSRINGYWSYCQ